MSLKLYAHPFSSYCQKVLVALYENDTPFEFLMLSPQTPNNMEELTALWPFKKFPVLLDGEQPIVESSVIIEHLQLYHGGRLKLVPEDPHAALAVRFLDRFFDLYIMTPQQKMVFDRLRPEDDRDPLGVSEAQQTLNTAYHWLERELEGRTWAAGDQFSMADCVAAPALFYADWTYPIDHTFANVRAYRQRLLQRPSFARAVEEARPYRHLFPLGAPDQD